MVSYPWDDGGPSDDEIARQLRAWSTELVDADTARRLEILKSISELSWKAGPRMAAVIPVLLRWPASEDREIEDAVCYALMNCAPSSISPLLAQLRDTSEFLRKRAAYTLGLMGTDVGEKFASVADGLLASLQDASDAVRGKAAFALGLIRDGRRSTVTRLSLMAQGDTPANRASALHAIGNIGHAINNDDEWQEQCLSEDVAKIVLAALDDADADIRHSACHALEALNLPAHEHFSHIFRIVETDTSARVQERAVAQLPKLAERCDLSTETARLALLVDRNKQLALRACETIRKIGPAAIAAVPALQRAIKTDDDYLALEAVQALWHVERRADLILPVLDRLFENNGERVCDIVCELGPAARPLLPKLLNALAQDDYWDLQWAAVDAVGCVASGYPETLEALRAALTHASPIVQSAAANALGKTGEPAIPLLVEVLSNDACDSKVQEYAAHALARMGPPAIGALPHLRMKLRSQERGLRQWSAIALAKVAGDAAAVPELIGILENEEQADIWTLACESIAAIGPAAVSSRGRLLALAAYPIDEIQSAAKLAIEEIDRQPN